MPTPDEKLPTLETLRAIALNQGLTLDDEQLAAALRIHRDVRPALERLRAIELDYLNPVEPWLVLQWIESGGETPCPD